ncbi:MAG TPA: SDR family oxidoreductase [Cyclobacteriaceae bacterium]|nr:SDR family oxidoreductase [Cyclobacteriaceae bacterium]
MKINLQEHTALIGGATSGLGKAVALQMAASGAQVTLMARNRDKLETLLHELPCDHGQQHDYLVVDFTDFENFRDVIQAFFDGKSIDILVNNTQGPAAGAVLEQDVEDFQQAFDLLFKTYVLTTSLAMEGMKRKKFGRIINVSSMSVKEPLPNMALSNSLRAAVVNWAKTLAAEVAADGITVNNILTGSFNTERLKSLHQKQAEQKGVDLEEWRKQAADKIPMKRFGKPEEYGYLATFLASEYAAYITGTNIPIDGGVLKSI